MAFSFCAEQSEHTERHRYVIVPQEFLDRKHYRQNLSGDVPVMVTCSQRSCAPAVWSGRSEATGVPSSHQLYDSRPDILYEHNLQIS